MRILVFSPQVLGSVSCTTLQYASHTFIMLERDVQHKNKTFHASVFRCLNSPKALCIVLGITKIINLILNRRRLEHESAGY